jgi:hypothetical protein
MRGIVFLSIFDWWYHPHGHSDMQLARAFSKGMPVLFVNSIGMRFPRPGTSTSPVRRIARKIQSTTHLMKVVDPTRRVGVATPVALPLYSGLLGDLNMSFVEWQVRQFIAKLNISKPIVIVTAPTYAQVGLSLPREALFYNRSDRHSEFEGANKKMVERFEKMLFREADVVLYAGEHLFRAEKEKVSGRAVLIGHGVDETLFTPSGPLASEMENIPRPRVGFFGDLRERSVNFSLIASVARLCPEIQFVLGGPQLDNLAELRQLTNVWILGPCPHHQMPARWRALDAAILPYKRTAWQDASEPIKLKEILATGLASVGTPLPAFTRHPVTMEIAEDTGAFVACLRKVLAISEGNETELREARRRAAGALSSWESIADSIDRLSQSMAQERGVGVVH